MITPIASCFAVYLLASASTGNVFWGKRTLNKYSLNDKQYAYGFTLQPYTLVGGRLDRLVSRRRP